MENDKILVEVAAYRDPDLLNTINSALKQADYPARVNFSICFQGDNLQDFHALQRISNCKIKHLYESESKGPCYARYLCQKMLDNEKYVFQIDSHMRFIKHWDTEMIKQLLSLNDNKATISYYPPNLESTMDQLMVSNKVFDQPTQPTIIYPKKFREENYFLEFDSRFARDDEPMPLRSPFIAAGNFFAFADAHREVLHDPEMCWFGDELPMAIRLYTHGWNNYSSPRCYIYHKYLRQNRAIPKNYYKEKQKEDSRLAQLLGLDNRNSDMGEFELGQARTLAEFEEYAGINFQNKIVSEKAQKGQF